MAAMVDISDKTASAGVWDVTTAIGVQASQDIPLGQLQLEYSALLVQCF